MKFTNLALFQLHMITAVKEELDSDFKSELNSEGRKRRDRRIPREALLNYEDSAWVKLFNSGNDQALINCTGLDHENFHELLQIFSPVWWRYNPDENGGNIMPTSISINGKRKGRPRGIDAIGGLALVLVWFRTTGAVSRTLSLVFGYYYLLRPRM